MARLRKDQAEALLTSLDSATSGPLEEITVIREQLTIALRVVLDRDGDWSSLVPAAAVAGGWTDDHTALLASADTPELASDAEAVLWAMWDLVTQLSEERSLNP
ncbi:MAG: hypothetical protein RIB98_05170 [Acidimicrobiales bacterium]